jgi:type IV secretory pathway VirB2 component (pilin)
MQRIARLISAAAAASLVPVTASHAQSSPFATGATAFQSNFLAILTPIAVIAVMALGAAAWFNRISWNWAAGGALGILLVFGAPQIVAWVRGLAGV